MPQLLGEHECKIDAKGRLRLPAALLKQLHAFGSADYVINRGMTSYLTLFPKIIWEQESAKVKALNGYIEKNQAFKRYFYRGATPLEPDRADRILLPKMLIEYAGIKKTVIIQGMDDRVEIWDKEAYLKDINQEPADFRKLAEDTWTSVSTPVPPNPYNPPSDHVLP